MFDRSISAIFFGIAFLVPLFFLSFTPEQFEFNKQALLVLGVAALLLLWVIRMYRMQEITFSSSRVHLFAFLAVLFTVPAAFFSADRFTSIFGFGVTSHTALLTSVAFFVLYLVSVSYLSGASAQRRLLLLLRWSLVSAFLVGVTALLSFSGALAAVLRLFGAEGVQVGRGFTTLGRLGPFSLFLGAALALSVGGAMTWRGRWQRFAVAVLLFFLVFGAFSFFRMTWMALFIVTAFLIFAILARLRIGLSSLAVAWPAFVVGIAFIFLFVPPTLPGFTLPIEVGPSFSLSLSIDRAALGEHLFTGFGQGQWQHAYAQFFPSELNQTSFWNTRFVSGSSKLTTMPAEVGIVGFGAWLLFLFVVVVSGARRLLRAREDEAAVVLPVFLTWSALAVGSGLAVGSMATETLFWLMTAALTVSFTGRDGATEQVVARSTVVQDEGDAVTVDEEVEIVSTQATLGVSRFRFDRSSFLGQLALLFLIFASVAVFSTSFFFVERYVAAVSFTRGTAAFSRGEHDQALSAFTRAVRFEERNAIYWRVLSEASLSAFLVEATQTQAEGAADDGSMAAPQAQAERIQAFATQAVAAANRAVQLTELSPQAWAQRARVFSALLPFRWEGADGELIASWERAAELDPQNPFYPTELGQSRLLLIQADTSEEDRVGLFTAAESAFQDSLNLKEDYAPAHYQLAVLASIRGNQEEATTRTETAVQSAPRDPGLRLQLGLLYFNAERFEEAELQFLNAIVLNENYANARYFLGLVLARQDRREDAAAQFEWLIEQNAELAFLQTILENVRAGRDALEGVASAQEVPEPILEKPATVPPELGL